MLARPAAIKLIRQEMLGTQNDDTARMILKRFEREAQATATLSSPHSIVIYDFGTTDQGTFYYVMELLDGMDLESLVTRFGPLPPARVRSALLQVCQSLSDSHFRGLIHRDIKPANIFLCHMGQVCDFVKVLDFGLVKAARQATQDTQLTQLGVASGTPAFIAPEQALGETVDPRTDLYALGCVGYWMLTGLLVFEGPSAAAMVIDHVKTTPIPPSKRTEQIIPENLERVILQCLEKDPEKRPADADELRNRLEECRLPDDWGQREARHWWNVHTGGTQ
jgi:serine/threonine-protein kinase